MLHMNKTHKFNSLWQQIRAMSKAIDLYDLGYQTAWCEAQALKLCYDAPVGMFELEEARTQFRRLSALIQTIGRSRYTELQRKQWNKEDRIYGDLK